MLKKQGTDNMHLTEQELFKITDKMHNEMNEVYKKASLIPEKYVVYCQSSGFPHPELQIGDVYFFLRNNVENHFICSIDNHESYNKHTKFYSHRKLLSIQFPLTFNPIVT